MSCVFSDHVSHGLPRFARSLMHRIHLVGSPFAHKPFEEVMRLVWVKFDRPANLLPIIFHILFHTGGVFPAKFVCVVHI